MSRRNRENSVRLTMVTLETERLRLRMFRETDLDAYAAMSADPEVMRYLGATGEPLTRLEAWRQMAMVLGHWQLRGYGPWAVEERASGALEYAFTELGQPRVISLIRPGNAASVRVAERIGERLEGRVNLFGSEALVYGISREHSKIF